MELLNLLTVDSLYIEGYTKYTFVLAWLFWFVPFILIKEHVSDEKYSANFELVWKWVLFVVFIGALVGGSFKRVVYTFIDDVSIGVAELVGMAIAMWFIPLTLTYIITFIYNILKPAMKKVHQVSNKK